MRLMGNSEEHILRKIEELIRLMRNLKAERPQRN